jgi:hypothetical protein
MRQSGICLEIIGMRPHDHIGWVYDGPREFEMLARRFLAEGVSRYERLMYIADDPDPTGMADLIDLVEGRPVQVVSVGEVYGTSGVVEPLVQKATFAAVLAEARVAGYTGIRVAADNSALVLDEERRAAWMHWECVADKFMSENPVTGLCAFDRRRVAVDHLRHLASLHPLTSTTAPTPQYRLFVDDEALSIHGIVDTFAVRAITRTLSALPEKTPLIIDLDEVTLMSRRVLTQLAALWKTGTDVTFRGNPGAIDTAKDYIASEHNRLHFELN